MGILTSKRYHPEEIEGQHNSMVTKELFHQVQAILDEEIMNKLVSPSKITG